MTIRVFFLIMPVLWLSLPLVCTGQTRIYATDPGDHFKQAAGKAITRLRQEYSFSPQVLESIERINSTYVIEKQQLFQTQHDPGEQKAALTALQEQFEEELSGVLDEDQYKYYQTEKERIGKLQARAWGEGGKLLKRNVAALTARETQTMQQRFGLSDEQSVEVSDINQSHYIRLTTLAEQKEDRAGYRGKVQQLQELRQSQLQAVLSPLQYAAYRQDMERLSEQARKEAETNEQNREK